jgi:16S rRNA (guanine966-N2)-methyltransferase
MKQRVREAAFNLIGPRVRGTHVVDLFAGTGALAWEALSRGAVTATLIERHFPTARQIHRNATALGIADRVELVTGDTFIWARQHSATTLANRTTCPWLVFCSPPYELFVSRPDDMMELLEVLTRRAPAESLMVVESDARFDTHCLSARLDWDVRHYPPAVLAVGVQPSPPPASSEGRFNP